MWKIGMAMAILAITMLATFVAPPEAFADPGRIVQIHSMASAHVAPRNISIWLPDGYDQSSERYAVLYMHDGQNLFDPKTAMGGQVWAADAAVTRLVGAGAVRHTIIVGIDNTSARMREYMPAKVFNALSPEDRQTISDDSHGAPLSDAYLKFLVTELKPYIDRTYRTRPERAQTFVMGSSMGGLISLYAIVEYPDVFGGAGCVSTHWPLPAFTMSGAKVSQEHALAAFDTWLTARLGKADGRRIWFDHGDQTLDHLYPPYQAHMDQTMLKLGWRRGPDFESHFYPGGAHNEASWRARLDDPMRYLLATSPAH